MKLSFRNRIALFTAAATGTIIGMVFLLVYGVVYRTAYKHLDEDIQVEKDEILSNLLQTKDSIFIYSMPEWEDKEHQQIEVNPTFLQILDESGMVLFRSSNLQNDILLFDPKLTQYAFFNSQISGQRIRQGQFPIQNEQGTVIGHLTVGISQEESALVLQNLRTTLLIAYPLLLLVLFLSTSLAASKGIAPVQALIKAASGIGGKNMQERLPLPENEDEIYQLANTINELLQRIENGMLREKQFTADASHEIRTPLTAIRGTLEVLLRKQREPAQYEEKITRVIAEVDRLNGMLDQLLQLARLESEQVPLHSQTVHLASFCKTLAERWQSGLEKKNMQAHWQIPSGLTVTTDSKLLGIVLDNLLGNAIKYGHAAGQIYCTWRPETKTLHIRDDGPGISAEHLMHLFDRFYRVDDSRSTKVPGAGLGLSIAKKIADLLGIHLSVHSEEGLGADFVLQFPNLPVP